MLNLSNLATFQVLISTIWFSLNFIYTLSSSIEWLVSSISILYYSLLAFKSSYFGLVSYFNNVVSF